MFRAVHCAERSIVFAVLLGSALSVTGMALYPGGNRFQRSAQGYDFWLNFLCDGTRHVALNGVPNPIGAPLLKIGMVVLFLALFPLWRVIPRLFPERVALGRAILITGSLGTLGMLPMLVVTRYETLHELMLLAGPLCIGAVLGTLRGLYAVRREQRLLILVSVALALAASVDLGLYVNMSYFYAPLTEVLPALQKVILLLGICWMLAAARAAARVARQPLAKVHSEAATVPDTTREQASTAAGYYALLCRRIPDALRCSR